MRALNRPLTVVAFLFSAVLGCGQNDISPRVSCGDTATCINATANLYPGMDAAVLFPTITPMCCQGSCMVQSMGCDSGLRYLTSEPGFGDCVTTMGCVAPHPDMSMMAPMPDMMSID